MEFCKEQGSKKSRGTKGKQNDDQLARASLEMSDSIKQQHSSPSQAQHSPQQDGGSSCSSADLESHSKQQESNG